MRLSLADAEDKTEAMFNDMTYEQLVDYVTTHTGTAPVGNNSRKTLTRMAMNAKPSKAA